MAIAGITTVMTAAFTDMAVHSETITQANAQPEKPAEAYARDRSVDASKNQDGQTTIAR